MSELHERIRYLPPEIFNGIKGYVFTFNGSSVTITKAFKPPALLQVNQETRKEFANAFYRPDVVFKLSHPAAYEWLARLNDTHRTMIAHIEIEVHLPPHPDGALNQEEFSRTITASACQEYHKLVWITLSGRFQAKLRLAAHFDLSDLVLVPWEPGVPPNSTYLWSLELMEMKWVGNDLELEFDKRNM